MRGPRFANGYHVPPPDFRGWYRGPRPHAHYRSVWIDDVWYDAYGYPFYSPAYQEVVVIPSDAVLYQAGAMVAPAPVVVTPAPAVITPAPAVVTPAPAIVTPAPTTVVVPPPPPPPPPTRTERIVNAILGP